MEDKRPSIFDTPLFTGANGVHKACETIERVLASDDPIAVRLREKQAQERQPTTTIIAGPPRDLPAILNQWTDECLLLNKIAATATEVTLITRLGMLGQRLITEANAVGLREAGKLVKEGRQ